MRKKQQFSKSETISVYQFMEMCGLVCNQNGNILISHEAMMKKLLKRSTKFPTKIAIPVRLPFHIISCEKVKIGEILLVEDDYKKIFPYERPKLVIDYILGYSRYKRTDFLDKSIEEDKTESQIPSVSRGYLKYLLKKNRKELEMEKIRMEEALLADQQDIQNGYTEDQVKIRKKGKRKY